jgi:hypothetical protein
MTFTSSILASRIMLASQKKNGLATGDKDVLLHPQSPEDKVCTLDFSICPAPLCSPLSLHEPAETEGLELRQDAPPVIPQKPGKEKQLSGRAQG